MESLKHIIIRNAKIVDSKSKYNGQKKDILIVDGIIKKIDTQINIKTPFFETKFKNLRIFINNPKYNLNTQTFVRNLTECIILSD